ncbi:hypothetical protein QFZ56_005037 [Streptomyces achromogenes]|uniref:Uncharacterized protein n=1 Tax=Streptomyces achromogenes TaxID=67255 RepID=A0ABU0Q5Y4_STRAH|nr:hypothetical protein [Streptomyces achromogenes]
MERAGRGHARASASPRSTTGSARVAVASGECVGAVSGAEWDGAVSGAEWDGATSAVRPVRHSQPFSRAIRTASARLRTASFCMAVDR